MGQLQDFNVFACLTDAAFELLFIGIVLDDIKSFAVIQPACLVGISCLILPADRHAEVLDVVLVDHQQGRCVLP